MEKEVVFATVRFGEYTSHQDRCKKKGGAKRISQ